MILETFETRFVAEKAMAGCQAVVHLAAETGVAQSMYESDRYLSVNVGGTEVVAEHAAASGLRSGCPVFAGRIRPRSIPLSKHGRVSGRRCCSDCRPRSSREDDRLAPVSVYGESKVGAEEIAVARCAGKSPLVLVRPQNVVGAGKTRTTLTPACWRRLQFA